MTAASRRKGVTGEREAADVFREHGWEVRGLENSGDWLAFRHAHESIMGLTPEYDVVTHTLHVEAKRYGTRARFPEWLAQAKADAPPGVPPLLVTRADHGQWYGTLPLSDLLGLIG